MANVTIRNKEVDKRWTAVEALLKVDGSKTVTIPHKTYYNITASGFALAMVLQPGTSFSLSKRTTGGWALSYASGNLTWTVYNATTSLSVSAPVSATLKSHVVPFINTSGNIGLMVNGEQVAISGSTITGDFSNAADMILSGSCLIGFILPLSKVPSALDLRAMVTPNFGELALVPGSVQPYAKAYWTCQEKTGNKLYDSIEYFYPAQSYGAVRGSNLSTGLDTGYTLTQGNDWVFEFDAYLTKIDQAYWFLYNNNTTSDGLRIAIHQIGRIGATSFGVLDAYPNYTPPLNVWANYKVEVKTDNILYLSINGVQVGTANFGTMIFNSNPTVKLTPGAMLGGNKINNIKFTVAGTTVFYYKCDELSGSTLYDYSGNNRHITDPQMLSRVPGPTQQPPANHATLAGYSGAELGTTDKTTQTARVNFYDKTTTNFWDGSGNELRTGFPDLVNALLIDATHTISFPLSDTVTLSYKGHGVIAYRLKSGQTLTTLETKWLEKNLLYGNPNPAIVRKLDAFYQLGNVNSGTLEVPNLLTGGNNATVSSNYSVVTINSLR